MPSAVGIRSTFSVHGEVVHRFQSEPKASPDERPGSAGGGAKSELQEEAMEVDEKFDHRYIFMGALSTRVCIVHGFF